MRPSVKQLFTNVLGDANANANKRNECVKLTLHFKQTYKIRELAAMTVWRWRGWRQGDRGSDEVVAALNGGWGAKIRSNNKWTNHFTIIHILATAAATTATAAAVATMPCQTMNIREQHTAVCWYAHYAVQCPCVCVCAMLCRSVINLSVSQGGLLLQISHCSYTRIQWNGIKLQHAIAKGQAREFTQHIHIYIK